jgi:hypothetical protein
VQCDVAFKETAETRGILHRWWSRNDWALVTSDSCAHWVVSASVNYWEKFNKLPRSMQVNIAIETTVETQVCLSTDTRACICHVTSLAIHSCTVCGVIDQRRVSSAWHRWINLKLVSAGGCSHFRWHLSGSFSLVVQHQLQNDAAFSVGIYRQRTWWLHIIVHQP